MNQSNIDQSVRFATEAAMNGNPVKNITHVPPQTGTQDPDGSYIVQYCEPATGSLPFPWLRQIMNNYDDDEIQKQIESEREKVYVLSGG